VSADLTVVRAYPDLCTEGVTRRGVFQPCEKPAVAVRIDPNEGTPYPVCIGHARVVMVPLAELLGGAS
jgi:hypothetical protein